MYVKPCLILSITSQWLDRMITSKVPIKKVPVYFKLVAATFRTWEWFQKAKIILFSLFLYNFCNKWISIMYTI